MSESKLWRELEKIVSRNIGPTHQLADKVVGVGIADVLNELEAYILKNYKRVKK